MVGGQYGCKASLPFSHHVPGLRGGTLCSPEIQRTSADTMQADKRFFALLKKHFDSAPVEDDRPGERERYNREGVTLSRLVRRR